VSDRGWILGGLAVVVALVMIPFWGNLSVRADARGPGLAAPAQQTTCVLPVNAMAASHARLLLQWMNTGVRENHHTFTAFNGKVYPVSLESTCLSCHTSASFCNRCHNYVGASAPSCWHCHQGTAQVSQEAP